MSETNKSLKFYKVCVGASPTELKERNEKVLKGEIKWSHFAIDNEKFCHFYSIIKK